jgi:hypothetical protein
MGYVLMRPEWQEYDWQLTIWELRCVLMPSILYSTAILFLTFIAPSKLISQLIYFYSQDEDDQIAVVTPAHSGSLASSMFGELIKFLWFFFRTTCCILFPSRFLNMLFPPTMLWRPNFPPGHLRTRYYTLRFPCHEPVLAKTAQPLSFGRATYSQRAPTPPSTDPPAAHLRYTKHRRSELHGSIRSQMRGRHHVDVSKTA